MVTRHADGKWGIARSSRTRESRLVVARSVDAEKGDAAPTATATATSTSTPSTSASAEAATASLLSLLSAVPDRGVYGLPSEQKEAILAAIAELESHDGGKGNKKTSSVAERLPDLAGAWRVLFSTVTITGSKRIKLGLKSAVTLGDIVQEIDPESSTATNEVGFELKFLGGGGRGSLRLEAKFAVTGESAPRRVDIELASAVLTPPALDSLLRQHMQLLLSIFNPEGWLETTYADERIRVGRDDKGRVFVLERVV